MHILVKRRCAVFLRISAFEVWLERRHMKLLLLCNPLNHVLLRHGLQHLDELLLTNQHQRNFLQHVNHSTVLLIVPFTHDWTKRLVIIVLITRNYLFRLSEQTLIV